MRLATLFLLTLPALAGGADERSPFEMVRFEGQDPQVQIKGKWYELVSLDKIPKERIIAGCKAMDAGKWDKRFCEDLIAVLNRLGAQPKSSVQLVLKDLKSGKTIQRKVSMTEAKRKVLRAVRPRAQRGSAEDVERIRREHTAKPDKRFRNLTVRHHEGSGGPQVTRAQAEADLDQLEWKIANEFSYRDRLGYDYKAGFDTIRLGLGESIDARDFHIQLRKAVALFGDGHSRVRGVYGKLPSGYLPFALAETDIGVVALDERGKPVHAKYPLVKKIDGIPLAKWLGAAARIDAAGSSQFVRRAALQNAGFAAFVRKELGRRVSKPIRVEFASPDGDSRIETVATAGRPSRAEIRYPDRARVLRGGIGYLPIRSMGHGRSDAAGLIQQLKSLEDTKGLIIDVRDNSGGTRVATLALLPHFMRAGEKTYVANVAALRLPTGLAHKTDTGYLDNRYLYPRGWSGFGPAGRKAIDALKKDFKPAMALDPAEFSEWHYFVLRRKDATFHYDKPIVLLIDSGCFSATDIFVGAFAGRPGVTLMGTATGGGSGRTQSFQLANSGLRIKLSTMASFRRDGSMYDGSGIKPDVVRKPTLKDCSGEGDSILEAARKRLIRSD
ncbi:MAG: S41 family peptidase [Planctomycetota bacterium]